MQQICHVATTRSAQHDATMGQPTEKTPSEPPETTKAIHGELIHLVIREGLMAAVTERIHSVQRGTTKEIHGELIPLERPEAQTVRHAARTLSAQHDATSNA